MISFKIHPLTGHTFMLSENYLLHCIVSPAQSLSQQKLTSIMISNTISDTLPKKFDCCQGRIIVPRKYGQILEQIGLLNQKISTSIGHLNFAPRTRKGERLQNLHEVGQHIISKLPTEIKSSYAVAPNLCFPPTITRPPPTK